MKYIYIIILVSLSSASVAKEPCDFESIGIDDRSSEIETLFFSGTCHYRNEKYSLSVESWEKILAVEPKSAEDEELKIDVLNNLGYMTFFGYGTEKDQEAAITYWREAISLGHYEAEYHLCHAYADKDEPTFSLAKARKHCEKAKLIYKEKADSDPDILSDIERYLKQLSR